MSAACCTGWSVTVYIKHVERVEKPTLLWYWMHMGADGEAASRPSLHYFETLLINITRVRGTAAVLHCGGAKIAATARSKNWRESNWRESTDRPPLVPIWCCLTEAAHPSTATQTAYSKNCVHFSHDCCDQLITSPQHKLPRRCECAAAAQLLPLLRCCCC